MPPSPSRSAGSLRAWLNRLLGARLASVVIAALMAGSVSAGVARNAAADPEAGPSKAQRVAQYRESLSTPGARRRHTLLPQTRYTVRKQIESIEPISWLELYGEVQLRELER